MVVTRSDYGDIIFAKVLKTKRGSGSASDNLTIVTLKDCDSYGNVYEKQEKMLCWNICNEEYEINLADRARKLKEGEIITARVEYDIGDTSKCVCYEMKKTGLYKLTKEEKPSYVIAGKVTKVGSNDVCVYVWIPTYVYDAGNIITSWYRVCFWNSAKDKAQIIKKGDYLVVRGNSLRQMIYNNNEYKELSGGKFIIVKE